MAKAPRSSGATATAVVDLASRLRVALAKETVSEMRMFGGVAFLRNGHMLVAASRRGGLLARVGKEGYADALSGLGATPMRMSGREMRGFVYVDIDVLDDAALRDWLQRALAFNRTLPPKGENPRRKRAELA